MARQPIHTPATLALCSSKATAANAKGRADYGQRWGRDIQSCSSPCRSCEAGR